LRVAWGHGWRREVNRLADDQAVQVAEWDFPKHFVPVVLRVAAKDLEAVAGQVDAHVRLVDASGGHFSISDFGFRISDLPASGGHFGILDLRF
jgi:hypothetical protein